MGSRLFGRHPSLSLTSSILNIRSQTLILEFQIFVRIAFVFLLQRYFNGVASCKLMLKADYFIALMCESGED